MAVLKPNALTTLANLKPFLGLAADDTSADELLTQLINQTSAAIEKALDRNLRQAVYTEKKKGTGNQYLMVDNYPVSDIAYIKQNEVLLEPWQYDYWDIGNSQNGIIYKDDGWTYTGYPFGLTNEPITGSKNIEVQYTAGYILPPDATEEQPSTLPDDLEGLAQEMIQYRYGKMKTGGTAGLTSFSIADVKWAWAINTPASWKETINEYRRAWL